MSGTDKSPDQDSKREDPIGNGTFHLTTRTVGYSLVFLFLVCTGLIVPIVQLAWMVMTGWYFFLERSSNERHLNVNSITWFVICLFSLLFLTHRTACWLTTTHGTDEMLISSERPNADWPLLRSCKLLLAVLASFIAGVFLVGITHEFVWMMTSKESMVSMRDLRGPARRTQSKNNLKQLGLALHNYHDSERLAGFPPSLTFNEQGKLRHGWMTTLLPYIDQPDLQKQIHFDLPWSAPENQPAFHARILAFLNPAIPQLTNPSGYALSHYSGNTLVLQPGRERPFQEMTDGLSNTILAGEVNSQFEPWGKPGNCRDPRLGINRSPKGFGSPFKGGSQFLLADGAVRFISETIDPTILNALATPDAGDTVGDY